MNDIIYTNIDNLKDFTIEMETGTGKTYTYIKTMYELNNHYGWTKFIVMVPSIAIREGVLKSFQITQDHFQETYHKKIRFFIYDSSNISNISNINSFVSDDSIQVMIINYQAFSAKGIANRRIYEEIDDLQTRKPIDVIKSVRPILIIDEPQKFGEKTENLFEEFNPLFTIRYSATHKKNKEYNKIYRLDAIDAYNKKLVKKINVKGIEIKHNKSENTYLFLERINISQTEKPEAIMDIEVKTSSGTTRKLMKIKVGDDLYKKSGNLTPYKGYVVSEIDCRNQNNKVIFTNGIEIMVGEILGDVDHECIIRIQIRETIDSHILKEKELYKKGIKVLSLFFIDEVAKYKYYENGIPLKGTYAKIFEEEYIKVLEYHKDSFDDEYSKYLKSFEPAKIHAGYFSIDKKGYEIDNINDKKEYLSFDENAYNLIMKDKERLLSLKEPVRFIFSHSALREGWDNPNIFQICTLKHNNSEISKRQEIGRGLRICVNNYGDRMDYSLLEDDFHKINTLTVIASESYNSFSTALQTEIAQSLSDRPVSLSYEWLKGKKLSNSEKKTLEFNDAITFNFMLVMQQKSYIDTNLKITDKFIEDIENKKIDFGDTFNEFKNELIEMLKKIFDADRFNPASDDRQNNINNLQLNSYFETEEFQNLWNKINVKTTYNVKFDTNELIDKSINSINKYVNTNKMKAIITEVSQKEIITAADLNSNEAMNEYKIKTEIIDSYAPSQINYDLINEITKDTGLTRRTIIKILTGIQKEKFNIYKYNPEEFIRKVTKLINKEKASIIVNNITYDKTDQKFSKNIFNYDSVSSKLGKNAISVKKHIYNYLITDSKIEMDFAKQLDAGEVLLYAKLPNGFYIPTPLGKYNPDWAIILNKPNLKTNCFVIETKGSTDSIELRGIELAKIECARKHFECLGNETIRFEVVDSYDTLMEIATQ